MTNRKIESSNTTVDESHNAADHPWTATHERTPYENVRALLRQLGPTTPATTILRTAYHRVSGIGPEDDTIVKRVREELAREHRCENSGSVIDCTGPARAGYRCPACRRQGQRETTILDAMADQAREARLPAVTDGGERR